MQPQLTFMSSPPAPAPTSGPLRTPPPPSRDFLPPPDGAEAALLDRTEDRGTEDERRRAAAAMAAAEPRRPPAPAAPDGAKLAMAGCSESTTCFRRTVKRPSAAFFADASKGLETSRFTVCGG